MSNWTTLKGEIRAELEEAVASVYSDASLLSWFNQGQLDFSRRTKSFRNEEYSPVVSGQESYELPARTTEVLTTWFKTTELDRLNYRDVATLTDEGTPYAWALYDNSIYLYPIPNVAGTLTVLRTYDPAPLTLAASSTDSGWDVYDEGAIKAFVKANANEQSGDLDTAMYFRNYYDKAVADKQHAETKKNTGFTEPESVW